MQTLQELGLAVAQRRRAMGLRQLVVAAQVGITPESLSRFERGRLAELGTRKLLAVLSILGMELDLVLTRQSCLLDDLRVERAQSTRSLETHVALIDDARRGLEDIAAGRTHEAHSTLVAIQRRRAGALPIARPAKKCV